MNAFLPLQLRQALRAPRLRGLAWMTAGSLGVLLIALLAWSGPAWSAWRAESALQAALDQRAEAALARAEGTRLQALQTRLSALEARLSKPASKADILHQTQALAQRCGLTVQGRSARTDGAYHQIDLSLLGPYPAQRRFLDGLDTLPLLCQVRSMRLSASEHGLRAELRLLAPAGAQP